jgi:3-deoxy-7-phosphoheptulonate synthase
MIIVLKPGVKKEEIIKIKNDMNNLGFKVDESKGENYYLLGLIGDTSKVDPDIIKANRSVEKLIFIQEPYKKANRKFNPEGTLININGNLIGQENFTVIAGPCSIESEEQIISIAEDIKDSGAKFLRGGAFKPRTSPYSFQGMGQEGLELLKLAKEKTGLPIVTELMNISQLEKHSDDIDIVQIGARNMQNFDLLKEAGKLNKPILLKRGLSATIEEFLMAAEYIMAGGNKEIILCERGIRTFENYTRNTLDLSAVPILKKLSHLPVIVDPSHSSGLWWLVEPLAKAAVVVGADGVMIEVHNEPACAKCDGEQSIKPSKFRTLMKTLNALAAFENKII